MWIQERYGWEAERASGEMFSKGSDLSGCVRFSLRPVNGSSLPAHDLVGVEMFRRFCRGFSRVRMNDQDRVPVNLGWVHGSSSISTPMDLTDFFSTGELVRQRGPSELCEWYTVVGITPTEIRISRPFSGMTADCPAWRRVVTVPFEYVHCVVCKGFRYYVRSSDGTVLVTPEDYELYL